MWDSPPEGLKLDANYIDVWRTRIDLPEEEVKRYALTLSEEERERAARFTFPDKYEEYVVSRGLLRRALAHVLKQAATDFQFEYTDSKKPYLSKKYGGQSISFNISHSHGQALVAISLQRNIGVDIEKIRTDVEYEKLASRFFSEAEHKQLMQLPQDERARSFFAIWTRKEAFVKAIGKGIAFGLSEFDVNVEPQEPPLMLVTRWNPQDVSSWLMATIDSDPDYMATLATDGGDFQLRCWQ
ncbi:MAG: 4'-phosphopantetheinyl transferase superfamily protein [Gammaproteobacteria bacterium]|jgi:4'-phosphopantetheinyl transferase|nr:4'-phosphopantetheinyl transferase superfamily protein [Gammaproteobacteria bacterium]